MKNAEHQVSDLDSWRRPEMPKFLLKMLVIDEKQEAIACIRMAVDNDNLVQLNLDDSDDNNLMLCDNHNTGSLDLQKGRS